MPSLLMCVGPCDSLATQRTVVTFRNKTVGPEVELVPCPRRLFLDKVAAVRTRLAAQRANEAAAAMEAERRAAAAAGVEVRLFQKLCSLQVCTTTPSVAIVAGGSTSAGL